jgi:hypothetical protein
MPADAANQQGGQSGSGPLNDPGWLAAGAAGLVSACLCLWAFRGYPLGPAFFWLAPLPLFLAGIGFGAGAAVGATGIGALVLFLLGPPVGLWIFVLAFAAPAAILSAAAHREGGLGLPLALLGILPAAGIAGAALYLADSPGGLEGVLQRMARTALRRFDIAGNTGLVSDIVRVKAAALGFWLSLAWAGNAWVAAKLLDRAGIAPAPAWSTARLPGWYPILPALALGLWLAADEGGDAIELSLLLVLLTPLLLHGLAVLHTRTRGRGERPLLLGGIYVALVIMFLPTSLAVAGYGAFDLLARRPPSTPGGRAAPPSS